MSDDDDGSNCVLIGKPYKVGDLPPDGYLQWHEWAGVQYRGGLRQTRCAHCSKWLFPQERASHPTITAEPITRGDK